MLDFSIWHGWVIVGILLAIAELMGAQFIFLALAVSCLVGAGVAAWTDLGIVWQIGLSAVATVFLVPGFVFLAQRHAKPRVAGLVGEGTSAGKQYEIIEYHDHLGIKMISGVHPVKAIDGDALSAGQRVQLIRIEGITALVRPLQAEVR